MLTAVYTALLDFLFPPHCPACGDYQDRAGQWCPACLAKTIQVHRLPLTVADGRCLQSVQSLGRYRGGMKKLIQQLKYQKKSSSLAYIQTFLTAAQPQAELLAADYIVPVPLHAAKKKQRGFNQAEKIFHPWARATDYIWLEALERIKPTSPQYELSARDRRSNMKDAFAVKPGTDLKNKNILLVDDIFTTGATLQACAAALRRAGAGRIHGLVLASDSQ